MQPEKNIKGKLKNCFCQLCLLKR